MGTRISLDLNSDGNQAEARAERAIDAFEELETVFSLFRGDSEICRVNRAAGSGPIQVSGLFSEALDYALRLAAASEGKFDPTVGVLTWPGGGGHGLPRRSYADVLFDRIAGTVSLPVGTALDLNAVVKGWAIDLAMGRLGGEESALLEAGGDVKVRGLPEGKAAWEIGVRDPADPRKISTVLSVTSGSVCTTGDYFRGGDARPHLVGPDRGNASVTVAAASAREADALSTAAYFMEVSEGIEFIESRGATALVIGRDGRIYAGERMRSMLVK